MALTLKQKRFVLHYVETGNATEAARRAGYKNDKLTTIGTIAYENMQKPAIQQAISQELSKIEITPEWLMNEFKKVAISTYDRASDKLKALENLAKMIEATGFKQSNQNPNTLITGPINISFGKPPEVLALPSHNTDIIEGEIVD